jgi:hypothetical protein
MLNAEETQVQNFLHQVLSILEMTQEDFEMTHSKLANDPTTAEYVMAA